MRRFAAAVGIVALLGLLGLTALVLAPPPPLPAARPDPAPDYAAAIARFEAQRAREPAGIRDVCRPRLLVHGARAPRAIVMLHGFTNCPQQFEQLAERCYAGGDNVVLARLPAHGFLDQRGPLLATLTGDTIARATDEAIDVARGLGDSVIVVGLSVGAVAAAWAGEQRHDVTRAVVIAPVFGIRHVPAWLTRLLARVWRGAPDRFVWWDAKARERLAGARYCYWGWSTRGLAAMLELGFAVRERAAAASPGAGALVMVLNAHDPAIDNDVARTVARDWARRAPGRVRTYLFAESLRLGHDLIDPEQPDQRVEVVYPVIERLLAGAGTPLVAR